MGDRKEGHPPDVVGLTLEEAEEQLAEWRVEAVVTAPPAPGKAPAGCQRSQERQQQQRSRVPRDARVIRQTVREGGVVVLTVAAEGPSGGEGPRGDGCGE